MKPNLRYLLGISMIFSLVNCTIFAQSKTPISISNTSSRTSFSENVSVFLKNGVAILNGDLDNTTNKYLIGFGIEKKINKNIILGLGIDLGSIEGTRSNYNFTSKTSFSQISVFAKTNLLPFILPKLSKFEVNPYVGIGLVNYNATSIQNGEVIRYVSGSAASPGSVSDLSFMYGVECNYLISKKVKVGVDLQNNFVQSDRFDAIVNNMNGGFGYTFLGLVKDELVASEYKSNNDVWRGLRLKVSYVLK